ncbi:hypothetical protein BSAF29S_04405 [Bacillus safensis subsp. safensis]
MILHEETKHIGKGILSGLIAIFVVMVVTSLLVSLMLTFTSNAGILLK